MKKKILIIMPSMYIGGAERSLIGLLDRFDYSKYDVSVFLYRYQGEFLEYIPQEVHFLPELKEYNAFETSIKEQALSKHWLEVLLRLYGKFNLFLLKKIHNESLGVWASMQMLSKSLLPVLPDLKGAYDLAISFQGIPDVLIKKVHAKKKVAWIHTDYSTLGPIKKYDRKVYQDLDYIVNVSESCTEMFVRYYPEFKSKALTIENIISPELIRKLACDEINDMHRKNNEIILLSVGRFCYAKNFDNVPEICKLINASGCRVSWYLIGYGNDEDLIRSCIKAQNMENYVIVLGKKVNPYPYIAACDYYIQPSRYEGKCVSVIEAQILHKPVIITNYETANNQLSDGQDGIIVPMDNKGCADGILSIIKDSKLKEKLISNTYLKDYSNSQEVEKIYNIIEA